MRCIRQRNADPLAIFLQHTSTRGCCPRVATEAFSLALEAAEARGAHEEAANAETGLEMVGRYERVEMSRRVPSGPAAQLAEAFVHSLEEVAAGAGQEAPTPPL